LIVCKTQPIMNTVPPNPKLFWSCFLGGSLGPVFGTVLISLSRRPHDGDRAFLLSWLLWLSGTVLLIACTWSVRSILLGTRGKSQRPAWLYRACGWLALIELLIWGHTVVRVIGVVRPEAQCLVSRITGQVPYQDFTFPVCALIRTYAVSL